MGRPSKVEVEKREKIKDLGLFVRDSDIYRIFEEETKKMSIHETSYVFSVECGYRNTHSSAYLFGDFNETYLNFTELMKIMESPIFGNYFNTKRESMRALHSIDIDIFVFYYELIKHSKFKTISTEKPFDYRVINIVYFKDFIKILGEERADELFSYYGESTDLRNLLPENIKEFNKMYDGYERFVLSEEELKKVRKFYFTVRQNSYRTTPHSTLIKRDYHAYGVPLNSNAQPSEPAPGELYIDYDANKTKSVYVELDFTKPIEELKEFITKIKDDFDNNHTSIQNIYDLLGDGGEIFQCNLKDCDIYKSNNVKPIEGRLADVFFIYDCKKAGLDNDYIIDEINRYWIDIKNLYKDKFRASTLTEYHNLAKDYIDNQKYECYLSGYDLKA